ncbi:MAG: serine protease, partial [Bacteroidales bacterium]|nr:serine protease [Bacteroidales bacterium]
ALLVIRNSIAQDVFDLGPRAKLNELLIKDKHDSIINLATLSPNFTTPTYDNDSLYYAHNEDNEKYLTKFGYSVDCGKSGKFEQYYFKENAHKIELESGNLWVFRAETETGVGVDLRLEDYTLPTHCKIMALTYDSETGIFNNFDGNYYKSKLQTVISSSITKCLYLLYYEPNELTIDFDFKLQYWTYIFVDNQNLGKHLYGNLKSGLHGTSAHNANCNNDLKCNNPEFTAFENYYRAAGFLMLRYQYLYNGSYHTRYRIGTVSFINKSGDGYAKTERPYLLTSQHHFRFEHANQVFDLRNAPNTLYRLYINYYNDVCNSTKEIPGSYVATQFEVIKSGPDFDMYNLGGSTNSDWVLLQTNTSLEDLSHHDILYAGWRKYVNQDYQGIGAFGYPMGDVLKIFYAPGGRYRLNHNEYHSIQWSIGANEEGASGGPVFSSHGDLVGIITSYEGTPACGQYQTDQTTISTSITSIYDHIRSYIDPGNKQLSASKSYEEYQAEHCNDCTQNYDETGLDCGNSCRPCYVPHTHLLATKNDISINNVQAKHSLIISPSDNQNVIGANKTYTSGDQILMERNIYFKTGSTLSATIDHQLAVNDTERSASIACLELGNAVGINSDGSVLPLYMIQKGVVNYKVEVFNAWNVRIYNGNQHSVYTDGLVPIYQGEGTNTTETVRLKLTCWDTNNNSKTKYGNIHVVWRK